MGTSSDLTTKDRMSAALWWTCLESQPIQESPQVGKLHLTNGAIPLFTVPDWCGWVSILRSAARVRWWLGLPAYHDLDQQTLLRSLKSGSQRGEIQMGLIPNFNELKDTYDEAFVLLRRAVDALEKLAAEQERANDLYADVNQVSPAKPRNASKL